MKNTLLSKEYNKDSISEAFDDINEALKDSFPSENVTITVSWEPKKSKTTRYAIKWKGANNQAEKDDAFVNLHKMSTWWYKCAWNGIKYVKQANYQEFVGECAICLHDALESYNPRTGNAFNSHLIQRLRNVRLDYLISLAPVVLPRKKYSEKNHFMRVIEHLKNTASLTPSVDGEYKNSYLDEIVKPSKPVYEYCNPFDMLDTLSPLQRRSVKAQYGECGAMGRVEFMELKTGVSREWVRVVRNRAIKELRKLFKSDMEVLGYEI